MSNNSIDSDVVELCLSGQDVCGLMALLAGRVWADLDGSDSDGLLKTLRLMDRLLNQACGRCYPYSLRGQASAATATLALIRQSPRKSADVLSWLSLEMLRIVNEAYPADSGQAGKESEHVCDGCPCDPAEAEFAEMSREVAEKRRDRTDPAGADSRDWSAAWKEAHGLF